MQMLQHLFKQTMVLFMDSHIEHKVIENRNKNLKVQNKELTIFEFRTTVAAWECE